MKRREPDDRRGEILEAALSLAVKIGIRQITHSNVAVIVGIHRTLVSHYFGTPEDLQNTVLQAAIDGECLPVIAQGLAARNPLALGAPEVLRARAVTHLMEV